MSTLFIIKNQYLSLETSNFYHMYKWVSIVWGRKGQEEWKSAYLQSCQIASTGKPKLIIRSLILIMILDS
jgi:hypothetical protein